MDHRAVQSGPADERFPAGLPCRVVGDLLVLGVGRSPERRGPVNVAVEQVDRGALRPAQARRTIENGVQNGGQLARSAPHDAEHLGERGFARPRFRELPLDVGRSAQLLASRVRPS